jgi:hypothetical protein
VYTSRYIIRSRVELVLALHLYVHVQVAAENQHITFVPNVAQSQGSMKVSQVSAMEKKMEMLAMDAERAIRKKSALLEQERRRDKDAISAATAVAGATVTATAVMANARDTASLSPRASGKYKQSTVHDMLMLFVV